MILQHVAGEISDLDAGQFYVLLLNSLDPDQDQHFVGPDLDPRCLQTL